MFGSCAAVLAAGCTGDDAVYLAPRDAGPAEAAARPIPVVPTVPPSRPDAASPNDGSTEASVDASAQADATSDGASGDAETDAIADASADSGPPTGLGPDGIVRGTVPAMTFSFVARLPSASALCPAYATVLDGCCVWSATIQSPGRLAFTYGLSAVGADRGKITIDGFDFRSLAPQSWDWTMGSPPGLWPSAQLRASTAAWGSGRGAWPRFLELMHHLATRYGTADDARNIRDFTDKGLVTSVIFSSDLTAHSIGWFPEKSAPNQLKHDWYVPGAPGAGVQVNQRITTPACQSTFDPSISQYTQLVSY